MSLMSKIYKITDEEIEALPPAQKDAMQHIRNIINKKRRIKRLKYKLESDVWKRDQSDKKLENAKRELKKYKNAENIVLQLAGLPTKAQDRRNRIQAINRYFDLLNLLENGQVGKKQLPFSAFYNQVRPVTLLFEYVAESAFYDEENWRICIDGAKLYRLVIERLKEQHRLRKEAEQVFEQMEKEMKNN